MGEEIKIGPVGSGGGDPWDEKGNFNVVRIFISHGEAIRSLQFQYIEKTSKDRKKNAGNHLLLSHRYGTNSGDKFDIIKLNHPVEYITKVSGHKRIGGHLCSLTIVTNLNEYGPFGSYTKWDQEFVFRLGDDGQFGGFHGSSDGYSIKSIGIYLRPMADLKNSCPMASWIFSSMHCCCFPPEKQVAAETKSKGHN
ncbi:hypothetical protein M569_04010 [Genlisea aurea]|uniref:Jacalin-type lectin domain-containing protein n=1 Tax=Genlisea aurea TaxID=192259 RepID=S8CTY2_9LAMI|nr:hypothetical protein M569_04010 [Genlisea aurea]